MSHEKLLYKDHVVDELLPAREVHIIGGPSGSGKSTWLFQFMEDWVAGKPIFGYDSHPTDWLYLSCDRSLAGVFRTLDRMGSPLDRSRMRSLIDNFDEINTANPASFVLSIKKWLQHGTLFIDGIGMLAGLMHVSKEGNYNGVSAMLIQLGRECQRHKITIFGSAHAPKMKENEKILNARQKVLGSVAWAGGVETVIIIEPKDDSNELDASRVMLVMPRNVPAIRLELVFNDQGRLTEQVDSGVFVLDLWLKAHESGHLFSTNEIMDHAAEKHIPKRTAERWLKKACLDGRVENLKRALYKKAYVNN